jgi:hypothetical protein
VTSKRNGRNRTLERVRLNVPIDRARCSYEEPRRHLDRRTRPAEHASHVHLPIFDQERILSRDDDQRTGALLQRARERKVIGVPVRNQDRLKIERHVDDGSIDQVILVQADVRAPINAPHAIQFDYFLCHALCLLDRLLIQESEKNSNGDSHLTMVEC